MSVTCVLTNQSEHMNMSPMRKSVIITYVACPMIY